MWYSVSEAIVIIEQLKKYSINELDTLFNTEALPIFEELECSTAGAILTFNPENPWWLKGVIKIVFKSPLSLWSGKKFLTAFYKGEKGHGINLFKSKFFFLAFQV